jgi:hypothetical protein
MDAVTRQKTLRELADAFGELADVTPDGEQPLHVLFKNITLPNNWRPSAARAIAVFANWPDQRPQFYIDMDVVNKAGEPPRSNTPTLVLGGTWRAFSFSFQWPQQPRPATAVRAIQLWLTRFQETT